jgi:hypothetical protein
MLGEKGRRGIWYSRMKIRYQHRAQAIAVLTAKNIRRTRLFAAFALKELQKLQH